MEISEWTVYERSRYTRGESAGTIILDGITLPLGESVTVGNTEVVLQYDGWRNVLISYRADSEFSNRWYAKSSPWEDFAEAFSEYLFLPERLIQNAPNKFYHLELEFRRYSSRPDLLELLERALRDAPEATTLEEKPGCGHAH